MLTTLLALALAAAAPAEGHQRDVETAVFELCPQVVAGTLDLADPARLAAAGYTATAPRQVQDGTNPRAVRGSGTGQIVISGSFSEGRGICSVWFGGPGNRDAARALRRTARRYGYGNGSVLRLGDDTEMRIFRQPRGNEQTMTIFDADAGGELEFEPATTVVIMRGI